jgi:hypothetical protein
MLLFTGERENAVTCRCRHEHLKMKITGHSNNIRI